MRCFDVLDDLHTFQPPWGFLSSKKLQAREFDTIPRQVGALNMAQIVTASVAAGTRRFQVEQREGTSPTQLPRRSHSGSSNCVFFDFSVKTP